MRVELRGHGVDVSNAMRAHVERALEFALDRFRERVESVRASVRDVNGSGRGGVDKECRITVALRPSGSVVARARSADAYAAMDAAAATVGRSLARAVDRRRTRDRQAPIPGAPPAALEGSAP